MAAAEICLDEVLGDALDNAFFENLDMDDFDSLENAGGVGTKKKSSGNSGEQPDSFSRIDPSMPATYLRQHFPNFPGFHNAFECEIQEGQMLYLPAGWFHEVTSFSGPSTKESTQTHLALNYWMYPPDELSFEGFNRPYSSEYWPDMWASRELRYSQSLKLKNDQPRKGNQGVKKKHERHHHVHGSDCDCHTGSIKVRDITSGEHNHFLRGIRGMFGYGRRQHLHRFVNVRFRRYK